MFAIADTDRVAPGQEFTVAARFKLQPGWHIYWSNPGEAGLSTNVVFKAPPGVKVVPNPLPGPERFISPGDIVGYGYSGEVLVSANVTAPSSIGEEGLAIDISSELLACKVQCLPLSDAKSVIVFEASKDAPPMPKHQEEFKVHRSSLPQPLSSLFGATGHWKLGKEQATFILSVPGDIKATYMPSKGEQLLVDGQAIIPEASTTEIRVSYQRTNAPLQAEGVLAIKKDSNHSLYYQINSPKPEMPAL